MSVRQCSGVKQVNVIIPPLYLHSQRDINKQYKPHAQRLNTKDFYIYNDIVVVC